MLLISRESSIRNLFFSAHAGKKQALPGGKACRSCMRYRLRIQSGEITQSILFGGVQRGNPAPLLSATQTFPPPGESSSDFPVATGKEIQSVFSGDMCLGKNSSHGARPRKFRIVSLPCLRHESSLTPLLVLYKFKATALNLRGKRKERIGSFPGSYGNRGSGLERVSFDDARRPPQAECAQHRASPLTV